MSMSSLYSSPCASSSSHVTSRPSCPAISSQHGAQRRLHPRRRLVVELARNNALYEAFILFRIGLRQVVCECPVRSKRRRSRRRLGLRTVLPGPCLLADDPQRPRVRSLCHTLRPEHAFSHIKPSCRAELRRRKAHPYVAWIRKDHLVVIPAVSEVGDDIPAARRYRLDGMRPQPPVANIDDVDVLFDQDVARKRAAPQPVPLAALRRATSSPGALDNSMAEHWERAAIDATLPISPLWMRRTISTNGGALRIWIRRPDSLCLLRACRSRCACFACATSTPIGFSQYACLPALTTASRCCT